MTETRAAKQHRIDTVVRQGGFAARCDCGKITFGGFASRSQARAALGECLAALGRDEFGRWTA